MRPSLTSPPMDLISSTRARSDVWLGSTQPAPRMTPRPPVWASASSASALAAPVALAVGEGGPAPPIIPVPRMGGQGSEDVEHEARAMAVQDRELGLRP